MSSAEIFTQHAKQSILSSISVLVSSDDWNEVVCIFTPPEIAEPVFGFSA